MISNNETPKIALNALITMRGDLIYEIGELEKVLKKKKALLFQTSEVIKAMDPSISLAALPTRHRRGTKSVYLAHGDVTNGIYDVFRESVGGTITSEAVARALMHENGLDPTAEPDKLRDFELRVRNQFAALRRDKKIAKIDGRGAAGRWRLLRKVNQS